MAAITENEELKDEELNQNNIDCIVSERIQPHYRKNLNVEAKPLSTVVLLIDDKSSGGRVLCLDGGGVKGIIEAMTLKYIHFCLQSIINGIPIEEVFNDLNHFIVESCHLRKGSNCERCSEMIYSSEGEPKLHKMFDIMVGTSMGAIISVAMARLHMAPEEVCTEVENIASEIFPTGKCWNVPYMFRSVIAYLYSGFHRYDSKPLENYLKEQLKDVTWDGEPDDPQIGIVATKSSDSSIHLFSSKQYADGNVTLHQAIRASTAAPIYFSSFTIDDDFIGEEVEFVDGGLCANCPASFAMQMLKPSQSIACLISLGCGENEPSCNPIERSFQHARNGEGEWEKFIMARQFRQEKLFRIAPSLSSGLGIYRLADSKKVGEMKTVYMDWLKKQDSNWYRIEIVKASECLFAKSISISEATADEVENGYDVTITFHALFNNKQYKKGVFIRSGCMNDEKYGSVIEINVNDTHSLNTVPLHCFYEKTKEEGEKISLKYSNNDISGSPLQVKKKQRIGQRASVPVRSQRNRERNSLDY